MSRLIPVSVAPKTGKIRRNGPCPCGSELKFKDCCRDKVKSGELEKIRKHRRKRGRN